MPTKKTKQTCPQGHTYYKSSDCPTCPVCEKERKPQAGFLSELAAPARRALEGQGITSLAELSGHTEAEILALHGIGPSSLPKLRKTLHAQGLVFRR